MKDAPQWTTDGLHVLVLWAFAIAQPLFAVLSDGPAFFVAHHCKPLDVCLLVVILCGVLPALIVLAESLIGLASHTARRYTHFGVVMLLLMIALLPVLKRVEGVPGIACVVAAAVLAVAGAVGFCRVRLLRTFLSALAPAVFLFPGLFLFHSPVSKIVLGRGEAAPEQRGPKVENPVPVILVILDEFPTSSLMDENREIDPIRYPNFAALAREATWFRNATTVHPQTTAAIPSILTGKYPQKAGQSPPPTSSEYPDNIFTLLAGTYQLYSFMPCTNLCPSALNEASAESNLSQRMRAMASDIWVILRHLVVPRDLIRKGFPEITNRWADFRGFTRAWRDPPGALRKFTNTLQPTSQPRLYVLHCILPHAPFKYVPSGRRYTEPDGQVALLLKGRNKWIDDERPVARVYQRHLLQVGWTDTLIGELIAHLKQVGLYDDALIVITSDHGVCHRPGQYRREVVKSNVEDIMPVPLLIKAPHQKKGSVSDRNVESIDILPTIAHVLSVEIPWQVDGSNALHPSVPERPHKIMYQCNLASHPKLGEPDGRIVVDAAFAGKYVALRRKLRLFGSGDDPHGLYRLGPHGELVGRSVEGLELAGVDRVEVELENESSLKDYDPAGGSVPALIRGRVRCTHQLKASINLAVAVNGLIRGVAEVREVTNGVGQWSTIVAEDSFRPGSNDVQVYVVSEAKGNLTLRRPLTSGVAHLASKPRQSPTTK